MPRPPSSTSDQANPYQLQEESLTIRDHLDPDKHWIGESLPAPSPEEVSSTGSITTVGTSPFPARADHAHELVLHNTVIGNTANFLCPGGITIINNIATLGGEDWLPGTSTIDLPFPGVYLMITHYQIIRPTGVWVAGTNLSFRINMFNATQVRTQFLSDFPAGRNNFKLVIPDRLGIADPRPSNANFRFEVSHNDTVDNNVRISNCYLIRLSSGGVPTDPIP